jgi:hypothetical protein
MFSKTTQLAPIFTLLPIEAPLRIFAPAPIITSFPIVIPPRVGL